MDTSAAAAITSVVVADGYVGQSASADEAGMFFLIGLISVLAVLVISSWVRHYVVPAWFE